MRLAIPYWQDRVSPVLDVARSLLAIDLDHGKETSRHSVTLKEENPLNRARRIQEMGIDVLICGAISWPLEQALGSAGIEVIAQTCGGVDEVLKAYLAGQLEWSNFLMPGCGERKKSFPTGR